MIWRADSVAFLVSPLLTVLEFREPGFKACFYAKDKAVECVVGGHRPVCFGFHLSFDRVPKSGKELWVACCFLGVSFYL